MRDPYDAAAFDAYRVDAATDPPNGDVLLTCHYCQTDPTNPPNRYEPGPNKLLEIIQTARTHNLNCPSRRPT